MEGVMMSQQSGLKVLMNQGRRTSVIIVLHALYFNFSFFFMKLFLSITAFFVLFRCEEPLFLVLKAILF